MHVLEFVNKKQRLSVLFYKLMFLVLIQGLTTSLLYSQVAKPSKTSKATKGSRLKTTVKKGHVAPPPGLQERIRQENAASSAALTNVRAMISSGRLNEAKQHAVSMLTVSRVHRLKLSDIAVRLLIHFEEYQQALQILSAVSNSISISSEPSLQDCTKAWLYCKLGRYSDAIGLHTEKVLTGYLSSAELPTGFAPLPQNVRECEQVAALSIAIHMHFKGDDSAATTWCQRSLDLKAMDCLSHYYMALIRSSDLELMRYHFSIAASTAPPGLLRIIRSKLR